MKKRTMESPIGRLLLAADEAGVCAIRLAGADEVSDTPSFLLDQAAREIEEYFEGKRRVFSFPLSLHGTAFETKVWQALMQIPHGETKTYGQIAACLEMPKGARAVGGACRCNPLLIVVPCHRVIASSGALTGFAAGMEAKRTLLALEGHAVQADSMI